MIRSIALATCLVVCEHSRASDFSTEAAFPTLAALRTSLAAYTPATSTTSLNAVFSLPEPDELAAGEKRATRTAAALVSCNQLCAGPEAELLYATASRPLKRTIGDWSPPSDRAEGRWVAGDRPPAFRGFREVCEDCGGADCGII